jgi:hypothetical protein
MTTARNALMAVLACALLTSQSDAQNARGGYPNVDRTIVIAPGDTVQLLNRSFFDRGPAMRPAGRRLDLHYATRIPATDVAAREQQADRAAQFFGPEAVNAGARRLAIGICDTRACAENRDPPAAWFQYELAQNGSWRRMRQEK